MCIRDRIGAAHLVVADQERELDLSQKGNGHSTAGGASAVVTTHESIIKPAIGVVHDVSHATVATCSSSMSQIGHLERFVRGLVTSKSDSPPLQPAQIVPCSSDSFCTGSSLDDSSKNVLKRKPEQLEESVDARQDISPKIAKILVVDEECSSEVLVPPKDEVQLCCTGIKDEKTTQNSFLSSSGECADVAVREDAELDKDKNSAQPLTAVVSAPLQPSEDQQIQQSMFEDSNHPRETVESSESCELVVESCELAGADMSSKAATDTSDAAAECMSVSDEKNHSPPTLSKEIPDAEQPGNPKSKDTSSSNPKKVIAAGTAESKQQTSPVRIRSAAELNKKRTQTSTSVQEKKVQRVGTIQAEKSGRRSADEGLTRSTSARRKRDTGGWEWYGDPETKPVYFQVIWLC